jgi:Ead/Ea22-like protein
MSRSIDLDKLEALAKAATPGEWVAMPAISERWSGEGNRTTQRVDAGYIKLLVCNSWELPRGAEQSECQIKGFANAAFIAAANPPTVLALIERIRELEAEIARRDENDQDMAWERDLND